MALILLILLLAILLGGLGFALHALWWIAAIVLIVWLVGFVFRPAKDAAGTGGDPVTREGPDNPPEP